MAHQLLCSGAWSTLASASRDSTMLNPNAGISVAGGHQQRSEPFHHQLIPRMLSLQKCVFIFKISILFQAPKACLNNHTWMYYLVGWFFACFVGAFSSLLRSWLCILPNQYLVLSHCLSFIYIGRVEASNKSFSSFPGLCSVFKPNRGTCLPKKMETTAVSLYSSMWKRHRHVRRNISSTHRHLDMENLKTTKKDHFFRYFLRF